MGSLILSVGTPTSETRKSARQNARGHVTTLMIRLLPLRLRLRSTDIMDIAGNARFLIVHCVPKFAKLLPICVTHSFSKNTLLFQIIIDPLGHDVTLRILHLNDILTGILIFLLFLLKLLPKRHGFGDACDLAEKVGV